MTVVVTMTSGDRYHLAGYASRLLDTINEARGKNKLISLERDSIPTGQMIHLDPDLVMSIKDDR